MFEFKSIPTPGPVRPGEIGGGRIAPTYYHDHDFFDREKYPNGTAFRCLYSPVYPSAAGTVYTIDDVEQRKRLDLWQRFGGDRFEHVTGEVPECQ